LEQKLSAKASGEAREARQIHDALAEAVGQARLVVRGLCPVEMDAEGLRAALEHLAGNVSHLFHLDCTFTCRQPVQIFNPATALHLYRIAQEAVNNAVQHGQPRHVWVRLGATKDTVTLTVEDDGAGVPAPDRAAAGLGWEIMAYRARMIDGAFAVQPGQTGGTVVTCTCPNQPGAGRDRGGTTA
jgi:signal transduction histidine kinase